MKDRMPLKKQSQSLYKKKWFVPLAVLTLLVISLVIYAAFFANKISKPHGGLFEGRDFNRSSFELTDAYDICYEGIKSERSHDLLGSYLDEMSTHFDERNNLYLIVVDVTIGDGARSMPGKVYCTIDPVSYQLTYYKEVIDGEASVFSRMMSFWKSVMGEKRTGG